MNKIILKGEKKYLIIKKEVNHILKELNELNIKILNTNIDELELLRYNANGIKKEVTSTYYKKQIEEGKMIAFSCFYNNELVGGAYISNSLQSLFIELIFVKKEMQNNKLHIGSYLLNYILKNKEIIEEYFGVKFNISRLDNKEHESFYKKIGYVNENNILDTMKKRI